MQMESIITKEFYFAPGLINPHPSLNKSTSIIKSDLSAEESFHMNK